MNSSKPSYKVPSMSEIAALPWNGFKVASTFSGGGGSCLGYRMANYRVIWANEFIEKAQTCYKKNNPSSFLNTSDIRKVTPEIFFEQSGLKPGELDLFDGSPPCSGFSTAGAREKGWGKTKTYSDKSQRVDDLFFEYTRMLAGIQPKVFVAENVPGLNKGTAKGYLIEILAALRGCGYQVKVAELNAEFLGVPQRRKRLIFIGVRSDIGIEPSYPKPLSYSYSVKDAWGETLKVEPIEPETSLEKYRHTTARFWFELKPGEKHEQRFNAGKMPINSPAFTITQTFKTPSAANVWHPTEFRSLSVMETKRLSSFPDDFWFADWADGMERMGRAVPPVMMSHIAKHIERSILCKM